MPKILNETPEKYKLAYLYVFYMSFTVQVINV